MKIIDESKDEITVFSKEITAFQGGYRMAITGKLVAAVLEFLVLLFFILWGEILIMESIITIVLASGLISTAIIYSVVFICLFIVFFYIDFFLVALIVATIIAVSDW